MMKRFILIVLSLGLLLLAAACTTEQTADPTIDAETLDTADSPSGESLAVATADVTRIYIYDSVYGTWSVTRPENIEIVCRRLNSLVLIPDEDGDADKLTGDDVHTRSITLNTEDGSTVCETRGGFIRKQGDDRWFRYLWQDGDPDAAELSTILCDGIRMAAGTDKAIILGHKQNYARTDAIDMSDEPTDAFISDFEVRADGDPDRKVDEFIAIFERDGYTVTIRGENEGEKVSGYSLGEHRVVNITPRSVIGIDDDINLFEVINKGNQSYYFIMTNGEIFYSFYTFGGGIHYMCLWDYDGNGVRDVVVLHSFGSGMDYRSITLLDVTEKKEKSVINGAFWICDLDWDGESIFLDKSKAYYYEGGFWTDEKTVEGFEN